MKQKSPPRQTVSITPTEFRNDSCSVPELGYALEHGATGATSNPFIVYTVLKAPLRGGTPASFKTSAPAP